MNHYKAVNVISELVPEINQSGDPEGVLVKYASDNNLAPAELERLGQLFNTAKTLTFMKKATDNRGGNFAILDVPALIEKYTTYVPTKSANVKSASNPAPSHNVYKLPDLKAILGEKEVIKFASNVETPTFDEHDVREGLMEIIKQAEAQEKVDDDAIMAQGLNDYIHSETEKAWDGLRKLAFHVCTEPDTYSKLHLDSSSREDGNALALSHLKDWMGTYESHIPIQEPDAVKMASVKITRDTTGHLPLVDSLNETLRNISVAQEMIKEAAKKVKQPPIRFDDLELPDGPNDDPDFEDEDVEDVEDGPGGPPPPPPPDDPPNDKDEEAKRKRLQEDVDLDMELRGEELPSWYKTPTEEPKDNAATKRLLESSDALMDNISQKADTPIGWLVDKMKSTPSADTKSMSRDKTLRELQAAVTLQKAIVTDPILSESDPERVVSLYNSLYKANPDLMSDPNLALYTLREAVQYDGVTPHTFQQLADIENTLTKTEKDRTDLTSQKYKI